MATNNLPPHPCVCKYSVFCRAATEHPCEDFSMGLDFLCIYCGHAQICHEKYNASGQQEDMQ